MITKEQYLQAKKTIADYELQEYLSGNSGLLKKPARGENIIEEAIEKGFVKGAIIVTSYNTRYVLESYPYIDPSKSLKAKAINIENAKKTDVIIWDEGEGWLVKRISLSFMKTKSPLQDAMDRGYRKGAIVKTCGGGGYLLLTEDPLLAEDGRVVCRAQPDGIGVNKLVTIWNKEYQSVLVIEAPENK